MVDFGFGIVIVDSQAVHQLDIPLLHIIGSWYGRSGWDVDAPFRHLRYDQVGVHLLDRKTDDAAFFLTQILDCNSRHVGHSFSEITSKIFYPFFDHVHANVEGIIDSSSKTNLSCDIIFPVFKTSCIGTHIKTFRRNPNGWMKIPKRGGIRDSIMDSRT